MRRFFPAVITAGLISLASSTAGYAVPVVPNFTSGTITSDTTTKTTVVESIRSQDYSNGYTYTVSGVNVQASDSGIPVPGSAGVGVDPTSAGTPVPSAPIVVGHGTTSIASPTCSPNNRNLCYGTSYSVINQGQPFQLTETYMGPGIFRETQIDRTTTQESIVKSMSVFTQ
jgi:hypothetical protein